MIGVLLMCLFATALAVYVPTGRTFDNVELSDRLSNQAVPPNVHPATVAVRGGT